MLSILTTLALLSAPQNDLVDRLQDALKGLDRDRRERVLTILEHVAQDERIEAAERFLKEGCDKFESTYRSSARCCIPDDVKKKAFEFVGERLRGLSDDDKRAMVRMWLQFFKSLPDDAKADISKAMQAEIFKAMGGGKKTEKKEEKPKEDKK